MSEPIYIEYDGRDVQQALHDLQDAVGYIRPALEEIGEILVESTKERFGSLTGPNGESWDPNSPVTLQNKRGIRPLTGETGLLQDLINYQLLDASTLAVGSPMEYAAMQQFGGTKAEFPNLWGDIPARPFLGISDDDQTEILDIIQSHLTTL